MSDVLTPLDRDRFSSGSEGGRLDSWKAIADYLGRHVTTVQRWEREEALPVHRHQHEKRGSVYGYAAEFDEWLAGRSVDRLSDAVDTAATAAPAPNVPAAIPPSISAEAGPQLVSPPPHSAFAEALGARAGAAPRPSWLSRAAWALGMAALGLTIAGAASYGRGSPRPLETQTLAVLPLQNRSVDQHLDYVVDGMTEALITDLASLSDVRVIARQSVMQYRDSGKSATTIASELDADVLVEGAVQRSGEIVRVDIRLVDGNTGRLLRAVSLERALAEILPLQADLSRAIARQLHLTLNPSANGLAARHRVNPAAWDAYLRARFFWNKRTSEDMSRAIEWYERAIQIDPSFSMAHAGLADVYASLGPPGMLPSELIARGTAAAKKAIELDPRMGEPYAALGKLRAYALDWDGAESNFRMAIRKAPSYAPGRYWFGSFLANQRRCDEALAEARAAERLDPISLPGNLVVSGIELRCGELDHAIERNLTILEFDSDYAASYQYLGRAYMIQGRVKEAIDALDRASDLTKRQATVRAAQGYAYARAQRATDARAILRDLTVMHHRDKALAPAWSIAIVYAGLRLDDDTLTWLEHAYDDREEWLEALAVDERFQHLSHDARFERLLKHLGLPQS